MPDYPAASIQGTPSILPTLQGVTNIQNVMSEMALRGVQTKAAELNYNVQKKGLDLINSGVDPSEAWLRAGDPAAHKSTIDAYATADANKRANLDFYADRAGRAVDTYDAMVKKGVSTTEAGNYVAQQEYAAGLITEDEYKSALNNPQAQARLLAIGRGMSIASKDWNQHVVVDQTASVGTAGTNILNQPLPSNASVPQGNPLAAAATGGAPPVASTLGAPALGATPATANPLATAAGIPSSAAPTAPAVAPPTVSGAPAAPAAPPAVPTPAPSAALPAPLPQMSVAPPGTFATPTAPLTLPGKAPETAVPPDIQAKVDQRRQQLTAAKMSPAFINDQVLSYQQDLLAQQQASQTAPTTPTAPTAPSPSPGASKQTLPTPESIGAEGARAGEAALATTPQPPTGGFGRPPVSVLESSRQGALGKQISDLQGRVADDASAAQDVQRGLKTLGTSLATVSKTGGGFLTPGPGEGERIGIAKGVNTLLAAAGAPPLFDPNTIAAAETSTKESTRLGFDLARTLGTREAMQIVQQAVSVVPNLEQTPLGARRLTAGLSLAAQRTIDQSAFVQAYIARNPAGGLDAIGAFNAAHPPDEYSMRSILQSMPEGDPAGAVDTLLKLGPSAASHFDTHYGSGVGEWVLAHPDLAKAAVKTQF